MHTDFNVLEYGRLAMMLAVNNKLRSAHLKNENTCPKAYSQQMPLTQTGGGGNGYWVLLGRFINKTDRDSLHSHC